MNVAGGEAGSSTAGGSSVLALEHQLRQALQLNCAQSFHGGVGVLRAPPGESVVITVDTLVEGVHFPPDTTADAVAAKALAVNLSDLAAMGACPCGVTLALSVPHADEDGWLSQFVDAMAMHLRRYDIALLAADVGRGTLAVTMGAYGYVPATTALRRDRAASGDDIYVTGTLGDAGLALALRQSDRSVAESAYLQRRLERPEPRLAAGRRLRGIANAAIDVSDGLAADLGHILERSGVGAHIDVDALPLSAALRATCTADEARRFALTAGDDYELCFTVARGNAARLESVIAELGVQITRIGRIETAPGLRIKTASGEAYIGGQPGFEHFSTSV